MNATYCIEAARAPVRRRAFTMIEIMCVVIIMAIAAAIVFAGMSTQNDLFGESAARTVMSDLLYAQNRAIATQQNVYVSFNLTTTAQGGGLGASTYAVCSSLPAGSGTYLTNPVTHASYTNCWTGQNWWVSSVNVGGQSAIYFNALGVPYSCTSSGGSGSMLSAVATIVVSGGANPPMTISIQPSTGDITVQ
jgi:prepilin-type N-terminal cleavage/methylation domain-containing protein